MRQFKIKINWKLLYQNNGNKYVLIQKKDCVEIIFYQLNFSLASMHLTPFSKHGTMIITVLTNCVYKYFCCFYCIFSNELILIWTKSLFNPALKILQAETIFLKAAYSKAIKCLFFSQHSTVWRVTKNRETLFGLQKDSRASL